MIYLKFFSRVPGGFPGGSTSVTHRGGTSGKLAENKKGFLLIHVLVFAALASFVIAGLARYVAVNINANQRALAREQAFQIASAGLEYYRAHLAYAPNDFTDGTNGPGPYVHSVQNAGGQTIGQFSLLIKPPALGSRMVVVRSKGTIGDDMLNAHTLEETLAVPSFGNYAILTDAPLRVGAGTEVFGPVHANQGVHFDGLAHNLVTSASTTYPDPDEHGTIEYGVHTTVSPVDPYPFAPLPLRPDVFMAGRQFPVPAISFAGLEQTLADLKTTSQNGGAYVPPSNANGYHLVLKSDGTFDLYRVDQTLSPPAGCSMNSQPGWGSWSSNQETFLQNYPLPANGVIFVEDNAWVDGQINAAHVTVAASVFAQKDRGASITVNNNLLYTKFDGSDSVALIAESDIIIGLTSADSLTIDAALIAVGGRAGRYYYRPPDAGSPRCSPYHARSSVTLYGSLASKNRYGFSYTDNTGYLTRTITYDANLIYNPPPFLPLATSSYSVLSWREVPN